MEYLAEEWVFWPMKRSFTARRLGPSFRVAKAKEIYWQGRRSRRTSGMTRSRSPTRKGSRMPSQRDGLHPGLADLALLVLYGGKGFHQGL
jgi:hypothetical protein